MPLIVSWKPRPESGSSTISGSSSKTSVSPCTQPALAGRISTYDQQDPTLSLPRQLRASQAVLPDDAVIVAHFYDVESGGMGVAARRGCGALSFP